jgi:hypothetical protein
VYTIWAGNKPRVVSVLSLDVAGAFDNVSHARLAHNLRKRRVPETLVRWVEDFLRERYTEIRLGSFTLASSRVNAGYRRAPPCHQSYIFSIIRTYSRIMRALA